MSDLGDRFRNTCIEWKRDPCQMVRDLWHVEPDIFQKEALDAFAAPYDKDPKKQRIAMQACAGPGKTTGLAWMGWNFELCYDLGDAGHPNGLATSCDGQNLKANLWKELALWRERSPILTGLFEMTSERIFARSNPKTWFLDARSYSKTADAEAQGRTLSGLHSPSICYLIDESGDTAPSVLRSTEQGLSSCKWGKIATAGNPTSQTGLLHTAVSDQSHLWTVIRVTGDPDDPRCFSRQNKEWARQQIDQYGRSNPWVMAFILGQFPPTSLNALLGTDDVRESMARAIPADAYSFSQKRIGIDVARFGDDATVMFPRQGGAAFMPTELRSQDGPEIAARIALAKEKWGFELALIDDTGGWAGSTIDACRLGGIHLLPINFSGKADDPRYFNKRSEMHFRAAEWVKNGGGLPNMPALIREAVAPTYWFDKGKMRVVEKDQIKSQLNGHSPDTWDAFVLTFALAELPSNTTPEGRLVAARNAAASVGRVQSDWDPFAERD